jgi:hypothetical protein
MGLSMLLICRLSFFPLCSVCVRVPPVLSCRLVPSSLFLSFPLLCGLRRVGDARAAADARAQQQTSVYRHAFSVAACLCPWDPPAVTSAVQARARRPNERDCAGQGTAHTCTAHASEGRKSEGGQDK